jgi:hypothetical protein
MQFSTDPVPSKSKSKCLFFSRERAAGDIEEVLLNGDKLPWVSTAKHLGNHLSSKLNLSFFALKQEQIYYVREPFCLKRCMK